MLLNVLCVQRAYLIDSLHFSSNIHSPLEKSRLEGKRVLEKKTGSGCRAGIWYLALETTRTGSGLIKKTRGGREGWRWKRKTSLNHTCVFKISSNGQIMSLDFSMNSLLEERDVLSGFDNK